MTETDSPQAAERGEVIVRELRESDLLLADTILRSAFDTFTGVTSLFGDRDYVHTRWHADPAASRSGSPAVAVVTRAARSWG